MVAFYLFLKVRITRPVIGIDMNRAQTYPPTSIMPRTPISLFPGRLANKFPEQGSISVIVRGRSIE